MIMNTKFLTPSLLLTITTTTVTTNIVSLDIIFFHTVRTYTLSKWNFSITESTCSYYCISVGAGCSYQRYSSAKWDLLNLVSYQYQVLAGGAIPSSVARCFSLQSWHFFSGIFAPLICTNGIIVENITIISNPIILPAQQNAEESLLYMYT
jgi:hypothetical protein